MFESVYREVMADDLVRKGLHVEVEKTFPIVFEGRSFDKAFRVDLAVEHKVLVELKSVTQIAPVHVKQLLTYLRILQCRVGLVLNFGRISLEIKRVANGA